MEQKKDVGTHFRQNPTDLEDFLGAGFSEES